VNEVSTSKLLIRIVILLFVFKFSVVAMQQQPTDLAHLTPVKVVLLGQTCVGKSSLVLRFVQDKFFLNTEGTIGAAFLTKTITLEDDVGVKFEIWDTAGQERYHSLAPMYYRGAQAAIVVYDITSRESFEKSKIWVKELHDKSSPDQIIALVGNKIDLSNRSVDKEEAEKFAMEQNLMPFETSAKDGTNVTKVFEELAKKLPKNFQTQRPNTTKLAPMNINQSQKSQCLKQC